MKTHYESVECSIQLISNAVMLTFNTSDSEYIKHCVLATALRHTHTGLSDVLRARSKNIVSILFLTLAAAVQFLAALETYFAATVRIVKIDPEDGITRFNVSVLRLDYTSLGLNTA